MLFDPFSRGRYATDASIYQIEPIGVVVPAGERDVVRILQIAAEEGVPVTARRRSCCRRSAPPMPTR